MLSVVPGDGASNLLAAGAPMVFALEVANIVLMVVGGACLIQWTLRFFRSRSGHVDGLWSRSREFRGGVEWLFVPLVVLIVASGVVGSFVGGWLGVPEVAQGAGVGVGTAGAGADIGTPLSDLAMVVANNIAMFFAALAGWWVGKRSIADADHSFVLGPALGRGRGRSWGWGWGWAQVGRGAAAALIAIAACQAILFVTMSLIRWVNPDYVFAEHSVIDALRDPACPRWGPVVLWLGVVVATPMAEEFFFRGLLQTVLGRVIKRRGLVIVLVGCLFGLAHASQPQVVPALAVFGIILGISYERSGSLVVPIVAHALFNAKTLLWEALLNG